MAARFWVGGSGTWDNSSTTNWATISGGSSGASAPTTGDDVTIDNHASGLNGGTITVNANITISTLTISSMVGTLDFATNDNNITLSGNNSFTSTGSTTRTLNMGDGTWTLSSNSGYWNVGGSGFTLNANSSTISFTGTAGAQLRFTGGGKTYNTVTCIGASGQNLAITGSNTISVLTLAAPARVTFDNTQTITTFTNVTGTSSSPLLLENSSPLFNSSNSIVLTNAVTFDWAAISCLAFSGASATANNSFNLGRNSGITINAPSAGGNVIGVIGG